MNACTWFILVLAAFWTGYFIATPRARDLANLMCLDETDQSFCLEQVCAKVNGLSCCPNSCTHEKLFLENKPVAPAEYNICAVDRANACRSNNTVQRFMAYHDTRLLNLKEYFMVLHLEQMSGIGFLHKLWTMTALAWSALALHAWHAGLAVALVAALARGRRVVRKVVQAVATEDEEATDMRPPSPAPSHVCYGTPAASVVQPPRNDDEDGAEPGHDPPQIEGMKPTSNFVDVVTAVRRGPQEPYALRPHKK